MRAPSHIDPREIWEDRRFDDLAKLWLGGDHYKWRLLRANGVEEKYVTGDGAGWEKFRRFAELLPKDELEKTGRLPRMILYSLNPGDNAFLDTLIGSFQGPGIPGRLQHGSAWWFNDNKAGITGHLTGLANQGLLGNFVGMLTDSRSFLSYARHEYFRRILCDLLGKWAEDGEFPSDMSLLGGLVEDVCCRNARRYFNL